MGTSPNYWYYLEYLSKSNDNPLIVRPPAFSIIIESRSTHQDKN